MIISRFRYSMFILYLGSVVLGFVCILYDRFVFGVSLLVGQLLLLVIGNKILKLLEDDYHREDLIISGFSEDVIDLGEPKQSISCVCYSKSSNFIQNKVYANFFLNIYNHGFGLVTNQGSLLQFYDFDELFDNYELDLEDNSLRLGDFYFYELSKLKQKLIINKIMNGNCYV